MLETLQWMMSQLYPSRVAAHKVNILKYDLSTENEFCFLKNLKDLSDFQLINLIFIIFNSFL